MLWRRIVWPMLRTIPNDTHASLQQAFGYADVPALTVDGRDAGETVRSVAIDGTLSLRSEVRGKIALTRTLFPSRDQPAVFARLRAECLPALRPVHEPGLQADPQLDHRGRHRHRNGAKDRGDQAMIAYGAARFALASGDRAQAEDLWPLITWCLEYLQRKTTDDAVIASDSDELENRFPAGRANLNTSSLTYDALLSAAMLGESLGKPKAWLDLYRARARALEAAIARHFGATIDGFETYRYYDGNTTLRAWIATPLTVGIYDRARGTTDALFSPRLWTKDGLATEAGRPDFWDRSTLYALRGVFAAGDTERAMPRLSAYTRRRLLGEHVPYAVEAYPEGGQAHLAAESALYCRIFVEGMFGIRPTGLHAFTLTPRLPAGWDRMSLRAIHAFGRVFDVEVTKNAEGLRVRVVPDRGGPIERVTARGAPVTITF